MREFDVIVVGGGPAGLIAAAAAAANGNKTALLEKMEKPARKLRITGKGRCNITNIKKADEFLQRVRVNEPFFKPAFESFSNDDVMRFFEGIGLELSIERGERVFPASGKAWDVAEALIGNAVNHDVQIECLTQVLSIEPNGTLGFRISTRQKNETWTYYAKKVILATGGLSYPATGSTGDGYSWAHQFGHRIEELRPSLVPLETSHRFLPDLDGLQLRNVNVDLIVDNESVLERFGEMEFTEFGVTGPIILQISRDAVDALIEEKEVWINIDLKPALTEEVLRERIARELEGIVKGSSRVLLQKLVPRNLIIPISDLSKIQLDRFTETISDAEITALITVLKNFKIRILGYRPFEEAIVTAGGVSVEEINPKTLESKRVKGIYFAGELLDLDADTGGYNIQIALSTGYLAGQLK